MGDKSNIEWTDATWNPIVGCSIVSPGCTNCYAMQMAARIETMRPSHYDGTTKKVNGNAVWTGKVALAPDTILTAPLRWKRPRKIFVNSMGDLFHESIPYPWIDQVFAVMKLCPQHTFQILTKRAERIRHYLSWEDRGLHINGRIWSLLGTPLGSKIEHGDNWRALLPLPNVWLGVSCERQQEADERIPLLLATPAAIRFISAEPLLGPIDLRPWLSENDGCEMCETGGPRCDCPRTKAVFQDGPYDETKPETCWTRRVVLDWVIVGGESGRAARAMELSWARGLRDQCNAAGVPFFFKQFGEWAPGDGDCNGQQYYRVGKKAAGRLLDGVEHNGFPRVHA